MQGLDEEVIKLISGVVKLTGMTELQGKIIGILYIEPEPVSMEKIANRTGYSPATISNTMKNLETIGITQRIKKPGTKKIYFYIEKDLAKTNTRKFRAAQEYLIKPMKEKLPEIIDKYKNKVKTEKDKKKLRIIENYYLQLLEAEKIIEHAIEKLEQLSEEHTKKSSI